MTKAKDTISPATPPMEALAVAALPLGEDWRYEPKWDGFRCLAFKGPSGVTLISKSGKPLGRYFPEVVDRLAQLPAPRFVLDGELLIDKGDHYSFSELQLRLHPAESRISRLASDVPASFVLFDLLADEQGDVLMSAPLAERRRRLESFATRYCQSALLPLSPQTSSADEALAWLDSYGKRIDGIVAKHSREPYQPGERAMRKFKARKTADCVVGGFRYGSRSPLVGSLLLGLYDADGKLHHVGFTSGLKAKDKPALTHRLETLIEAPGFTGRAPGGPSRWSSARSADWQPLRPELVVEVQYDQLGEQRFRHGTRFLRWRPDKAPRQCGLEQLSGS